MFLLLFFLTNISVYLIFSWNKNNVMEYLAILIFIFLLFSGLKHKYKIRLFTSVRELLSFFAVVLVIGVVWDSFGIWRGHWELKDPFLVGIKIDLLPIEEYLFHIDCSLLGTCALQNRDEKNLPVIPICFKQKVLKEEELETFLR